jgi:Ion channel
VSAPPSAERAGPTGPTGHRDRYELVFVLLVVAFVIGAFATDDWSRLTTLVLYGAALLLALRSAQLIGAVARVLRLVLVLGSVAAGGVVLAAPGDGGQGAFACWLAAVLLTTIVVIVRRVLHHRVVTIETIFGALSAYVLLGFFFTAVFSAMARFGTAPFFAGGQEATSAALQYFSFVTLTTTGYGDYTALGAAGRSLAVLEALLGQIFLVTLVARLVAMFGTVRPGSGSPLRSAAEPAYPEDADR